MGKGNERAMIAMSGGVDSSVAAYLTRETGAECLGVTLRLYRSTDLGMACHRSCCGERDAEDAAYAAFQLGIPFEELDYASLFRVQVMRRFAEGYLRGDTPNPCIDCNRRIKFSALLEEAKREGFDALVTGHYARITREEASGRWQLRRALDEEKDQSYVLYMLSQEQLGRVRFPLGGLRKTETRRIAADLGLLTARKRESQDICFVPDGDYAAFLRRWTGQTWPQGDLLDENGRILGKHGGAIRYTLGQRKGLGLALGKPVYVLAKDMEKNRVTVGPEASLYRRRLWAEDLCWLSIPKPEAPLRVTAQTRYRQKAQAAVVLPGPGGAEVLFDQPQRAMTPGQAVVFYRDDLVLGGGTIRSVSEA